MARKILPLVFILIAILFIYSPVLSVYFSQDDFFHFRASQTDGSLKAFINLFGFPSFEERGYAFYRPIFREGLFNIYYSIFGLQSLPFRVLSLAIHLINVVLVYLLMQKIFKKVNLSLLVAFFFGISSANVALLYYLAGGIQTLGVTLFMLLTLIFWWEYLRKERRLFFTLSLVSFLLSLGSHELSVVTPILMWGVVYVREKDFKSSIRQGVKKLWPFLAVLTIFLYLDLVKIGILQKEAQYQTVFSPLKILNSFTWYTAWAMGLPEMLIDFVGSKLFLNPNLMKFWGDYFKIIFPAFFISGGGLIILVIYLLKNWRDILLDRKFLFLLFWFPVALSPVILLPLHKSTYYLAPALPAFWGIVGMIIFSVKKLWLRWVVIVALVVLSVTSIKLGDRTYPAAVRGRIAEKLINEVKTQYSQLPKGAIVYFQNDKDYSFITAEWGGTSRQAALILNNADALKLLYKDPTLQVFYEDLGGVPEKLKDHIFPITAKLN